MEIEKCPFCGSDGELYGECDMVKVRCSNYDCRCELITWFEEPEEAIAEWNRQVARDTSVPTKKPANIVVEVSGGMVQNVWADQKDLNVEVADMDVQDEDDLEAAQSILDVASEQGYVCVW